MIYQGTNQVTLFTCPNCNKHYKNKGSFMKHTKNECGKSPKFHCPFCNYKSHRKYNMNVHVALVHAAKRNNKPNI